MKKYLALLALLVLPFTVVGSVSAVDIFQRDVCDQKANPDAANPSESSLCQDKQIQKDGSGDNVNPLFGPQGVLTTAINVLSAVVGIVAVIMIVLAGLKFVTSGNNPQETSSARERIIYALVALVVAASAQLLVRFILGNLKEVI